MDLRAHRALALALVFAAAGCHDGPRASVRLVLTPSADLSSSEEIATAVKGLWVVVDSADGLKGVTTAGPTSGGGEAKDVDGDGKLEVLFPGPETAASDAGAPTLPLLQIDLYANVDRDLSFRVYGMAQAGETDLTRAIAFGGSAKRCAVGEVCSVGTPFNLKAAARPVQVIMIAPADGTRDVAQNVVAVYAVLSTTVDTATVVGASARVIGPDGQTASLSVDRSEVTFSEAGETARRTILTFVLPRPLPAGAYTIVVGPGIVSTAGRRFDQDPTTPVEDGFESHFTSGTDNSFDCEPGYFLDAELGGCVPERKCSAECIEGFVCDLTAAACIEDCRCFGACDLDTKTCNQSTGLCE